MGVSRFKCGRRSEAAREQADSYDYYAAQETPRSGRSIRSTFTEPLDKPACDSEWDGTEVLTSTYSLPLPTTPLSLTSTAGLHEMAFSRASSPQSRVSLGVAFSKSLVGTTQTRLSISCSKRHVRANIQAEALSRHYGVTFKVQLRSRLGLVRRLLIMFEGKKG